MSRDCCSLSHCSYIFFQKTSRKVLRKHLVNELRKMKSEKTGFDGATGSKQYFSEKQDGVPIYDVVNLNVRSLL